ncbi:MAG: hypothetical protein ACK53Y_08550, partial [bacterium]
GILLLIFLLWRLSDHLLLLEGQFTIHCFKKSTTHLLNGLRYGSISSALADHSGILSELRHQISALDKRAVVTFQHLDVSHTRSDSTLINLSEDLGALINTHRDTPLSVPSEEECI